MNERDENDKLRADLRADNSDLSDIRNALGSGMRPVLPELHGDAVPVAMYERYTPVRGWIKTSKLGYDSHPEENRRIVYAAPLASKSDDAQEIACESCGLTMEESRKLADLKEALAVFKRNFAAPIAANAQAAVAPDVWQELDDQGAPLWGENTFSATPGCFENERALGMIAAPIASALPAQTVVLTPDELDGLIKEHFGNMHAMYRAGFRRLLRNAIEANAQKLAAPALPAQDKEPT